MISDSELSDWFTRRPNTIHHMQAVDFRGEQKEVDILDFLAGSAPHYTDSFGIQWSKYCRVQINRFNGTKFSYEHLKTLAFGDLEALKGKTILEIGSGAGRYTDYLIDLGGKVITVDPSAISVNVALGAANLIPIRGDLFDVPVKRHKIDVVFCRGVVQHTVNTGRAITRLFDYVKPGGTVLFDVYPRKWFTPLYSKYWIRPFTRKIPADKFIPFAEKWVPRLLRFKQKYVTPLLPNNKLGTKIAAQIVPVADYTGVAALGTRERQIEWSVLDTVDMYTPRYDHPMTWRGVMSVLRSVGAQKIEGDQSSFCFKAIASS